MTAAFEKACSFVGYGFGMGFALAMALFYASIPLLVISYTAEWLGVWSDPLKSLAEHVIEGLPGVAPFNAASFCFLLFVLAILAEITDLKTSINAKGRR